MNVLEANIVNITLATPHICRICFQEKIYTNSSKEESTNPVIIPSDVQITNAIVKEANEFLVLTLLIMKDGEEVIVGKRTEVIYPKRKDPKSLHLSFSETEGDLMVASVTISYRLQKLTVIGTITNPGGSTGYSVVCTFLGENTSPENTEMKFKIRNNHDELICVGKLSSKSSTLYLPTEVKPHTGHCRLLFYSNANEQIFECNIKHCCSTVVTVPLSADLSIMVCLHPLMDPEKYPVMIHNVALDTGACAEDSHLFKINNTFSEKTRFIAYFHEQSLDVDTRYSHKTLCDSVWTDPASGGGLMILPEEQRALLDSPSAAGAVSNSYPDEKADLDMKGPLTGSFHLIGHLNHEELTREKFFKKNIQLLQKGMFGISKQICDDESKELELSVTVIQYDNNGRSICIGDCTIKETSRELTEEGLIRVHLAGDLVRSQDLSPDLPIPITVILSIIPPTANAHSSNLVKKRNRNTNRRMFALGDIEKFADRPMQAWGRSRINMVGQGAVGKTALSYSLRGKAQPQSLIDSTIGVDIFACDIFNAEVTKDTANWLESTNEYSEQDRAITRGLIHGNKQADLKSTGDRVVGNVEVRGASGADRSLGLGGGGGGREGGGGGREVAVDNIFSKEFIKEEREKNWGNFSSDKTSCCARLMKLFSSSSDNRIAPDESVRNQTRVVATNEKLKFKQFDSSNYDSVMKCLADNVQSNSKCRIALYDYGGQLVFNSLHRLFLSRLGVYTLVFNMDLMLKKPSECLTGIKFWLDSIAIYTLSEVKNKGENIVKKCTAPVLLVGTRKDVVTSSENHAKISQMIIDKFQGHMIFTSQSLRKYKRNDQLCFFPVDNTIGRDDRAITDLMDAIETEIDSSDYVNVEKPTNWFISYDRLKALNKPYFVYDEVIAVTQSVGIEDIEVPELLRFLHDMGMILWHDEESLRNIVIMDVVSFFVSPATILICDLEPTVVNDGTKDIVRSHVRPVHIDAKDILPAEYTAMKETGVVSEKLMRALLQADCGNNLEVVIKLMIKYGLICSLFAKSKAVVGTATAQPLKISTCTSYLVPVLLPEYKAQKETYIWKNTFYFLFATSDSLFSKELITWKDIETSGFLPNGFFEPLICRVIAWSQQTMEKFSEIKISELFENVAVLRYGGQRFRLTHLTKSNCIQVDVEGENPYAIYQRLSTQIASLKSETLKSLGFIPTLLVKSDASGDYCHIPFDMEEMSSNTYHDHSIEYINTNGPKYRIFGRDVKKQHPHWFANLGTLEKYDVFISHRWGDYDNNLVASLYDSLTLYPVGRNGRPIATFLDIKGGSLQNGDNFQKAFARALIRSRVVVPVVSKYALTRMIKHDISAEDNVLIEWIIALECITAKYDGQGISKIYPVLIGTVNVKENPNSIADLVRESDSIIDKLPNIVPYTSLKIAKEMMQNCAIPFDDAKVSSYTVKSIVNDMRKHLGFEAWTVAPIENLNFELVDKVLEVIKASLVDIDEAIQGKNAQTGGGGGGAPVADIESGQNWTAAFDLLISKNAVSKDNEGRFKELVDDLGIDSADALSSVSSARREQLASLMKEAKRIQFSKACGLQIL